MSERSHVGMRDKPGVIALPPLIGLFVFVLGLGLDRLMPIGAVAAMLSWTPRIVIAIVLFVFACWIALWAVRTLQRAGTNIDVRKPALALVTSGIFARTRNPIYVSLGILLLALALGFASDWTVLQLVPWALVMHYGVVLREERYLAAKFGDEYLRYKQRVPRYWPG